MKATLIAIVMTLGFISLSGQEKKFTFGFEYSPSFSNVTTTHPVLDGGFRIGHNIFLKGSLKVRKDLEVTMGVGFLNTRENDENNLEGWMNIERIHSRRHHNYLVVPAGLRYHIGSFYINPEIGIGYNVGRPVQQTFFFTDGSVASENPGGPSEAISYKKLSAPLFLSFGNEFDLNGLKIMIGAKAYYSLTGLQRFHFIPNNYYGFGLVTGVRF